jgi:quercetin dioxygenase-like cupin family protein
VLTGEIEFIYGVEENSIVLSAGESFTISPNTPHYFISNLDSVVMEWGPQMDEKNQRHLQFRAKVDAINQKQVDAS